MLNIKAGSQNEWNIFLKQDKTIIGEQYLQNIFMTLYKEMFALDIAFKVQSQY